MQLEDYLDNREIAILVWLGVFFLWAFTQKNNRKSLVNLVRPFAKRNIIILTVLMLLYIAGMIYIFWRLQFWEPKLLADTLLWMFGVAFVMFVNINHVTEEGYFKKIVIDNLKLILIIEFVVNLYVFDLWIELILVPILAILGAMLGVSSVKKEYKQVEAFLSKLLVIIGLGFGIYALYYIITDFQGFASLDNLKEFLLPIVFTFAFLPYVYIMALFINYELVFMRIKRLAKDGSLARYAKLKTLLAFHINLKSLHKWSRKVILININSKEDVKRAIKEVKVGGA